MLPKQAILFDLGGTLLYPDYPFLAGQLRQRGLTISLDDFLVALSEASQRIDVFMTQGESTDATRVPVYLTYLLEALQVPAGITEMVNTVLLPRHREVGFWAYLLPDTLTLLGELQKQFKLAVISNSDGRAEAKVVERGLAPFFEFVMDSHLVGVEKPDPRIFLTACAALQLPPSQCYYVGDIYSIDVAGARAAGLRPVLIDATGTSRPDCLVIGSLFELRNLGSTTQTLTI